MCANIPVRLVFVAKSTSRPNQRPLRPRDVCVCVCHVLCLLSAGLHKGQRSRSVLTHLVVLLTLTAGKSAAASKQDNWPQTREPSASLISTLVTFCPHSEDFRFCFSCGSIHHLVLNFGQGEEERAGYQDLSSPSYSSACQADSSRSLSCTFSIFTIT